MSSQIAALEEDRKQYQEQVRAAAPRLGIKLFANRFLLA